MKKAILLLVMTAVTLAATAQTAQDFASRFMEKCADDTAVHCITVSPRMMEQLAKQPERDRSEHLAQAIQKLKSARIVTASTRCESYYQKAVDILKRNTRRFGFQDSYRTSHAHGAFYTRKTKAGDTVELILLHADTRKNSLVVVNLTGDLDKQFVDCLTKNFSGHNNN